MNYSNGTSRLPYNTFSEIPTPNDNATNITGLVKESGRVTGYQLADGRQVSKEEGVTLAKNGQIAGVGIAKRSGSEYLKTLPDTENQNNLTNLPTVSKTE